MDKIFESILKFLKLDSLLQHMTGYVEARIELMKVEFREDLAKSMVQAIILITLILVSFLFLLFLKIKLKNKYAPQWQCKPKLGTKEILNVL